MGREVTWLQSGPGVLIMSPRGRYNEINAITTACSNGIQECETLVTTLFKEWMENPSNNP